MKERATKEDESHIGGDLRKLKASISVHGEHFLYRESLTEKPEIARGTISKAKNDTRKADFRNLFYSTVPPPPL